MELPFVFGVAAVLIGLAVISVHVFRNSAPAESIAEVLHNVEHPPSTTGARRRRS